MEKGLCPFVSAKKLPKSEESRDLRNAIVELGEWGINASQGSPLPTSSRVGPKRLVLEKSI
jgi:hypothetical protein